MIVYNFTINNFDLYKLFKINFNFQIHFRDVITET